MPDTNIASPVQPCGNKPGPVPPKKEEKHFINFMVLDDKGEPVEDVALLVKLPDGSKEEHVSNEDGFIEIKSIKPGSSSLLSDWRKMKMDDAVLFQG